MYENIGLATVLLILALAGHLGDPAPPCCGPKVTLGRAVLVFP